MICVFKAALDHAEFVRQIEVASPMIIISIAMPATASL